MINCNPRSLAFALVIAALPVGFAFAGGSGGRGGAIGAGVGAAGMGAVRPLAAEPRRVKWAVAPRRVWWGADRRIRTARAAMDRLERATPA
jgi:hypothetical protein